MTDATARARAGLDEVRSRIADAATRGGRDPADIRLVAVSKGIAAERIPFDAVDALGENRVQELLAKQEGAPGGVEWHFIGALQRNKAGRIVGRVALIHSIDSLRLAETVARAAAEAGLVQGVLLQVNTTGEPTKRGVAPGDAPAAAEAIAGLDGIRLQGLMTMAAPGHAEDARPAFSTLRNLRERITAVVPTASALSMGMTGDLDVAVEEGATIVRVGTAIFGPRDPTTAGGSGAPDETRDRRVT